VTSSTPLGADVVIVGAGILGASAALALARAGHSVIVLDRLGAAGLGSTSASAGIVRIHATDPQSCLIADDAVRVWESWAAFLQAPRDARLASFTACGTVVLDADDGYIDTIAASMDTADLSFERWDVSDLADRLPFIDVHRFGPPKSVESEAFFAAPTELLKGALYTPQSGYVGDPSLATANVLEAARERGARFKPGATVTHLVRRGDRVVGVQLADETVVQAEATLVAAGPNTYQLLNGWGVTDDFVVKTRRVREELHHVPAPPTLDIAAQAVHVVDGDLGINFRPETGNAFLVGGNGAKIDGETVVGDPDRYDIRVTQGSWTRHVLRMARRIPSLGIPRRSQGVVGLYDVTDDWLPIYDRAGVDGLFVALGTSGNQFKVGPIVGELLRHIIELESQGVDHRTVPARSPVSQREFWTGQFSRLRVPQEGGSRG